MRKLNLLLPLLVLLGIATGCQGGIRDGHLAAKPTPTIQGTPANAQAILKLPTGLTRSDPMDLSGPIALPNWDLQIAEMKRGAEAWHALQEANRYNDPPPAGFEYILVLISAESHRLDDQTAILRSGDFRSTGSHAILYSAPALVPPDPSFPTTLFAGESAQGWISLLVGEGEENLMLVYYPLTTWHTDALRYIALEEGASLGIDPVWQTIKPTSLGLGRLTPAPRGERVVTDNWRLSVTDVVRGQAATDMLLARNQFNDPPPAGMAYVNVLVHVQYLGEDGGFGSIDRFSFRSHGAPNVYFSPPAVVEPLPTLDGVLFPGGEIEGWITLQARASESNLLLVFQPFYDLSGIERRFLALE